MEKHKHLVQVLDLVAVERFVDTYWRGPGRPQQSRLALARAFIAKAIWNLPTTRDLIDRIEVDARLRRLCGWPGVRSIPSEATFSRAFAAFSEARLAERMHEALVKEALGAELIGHVLRDSTAIEAREKPVRLFFPRIGRECRKSEHFGVHGRAQARAGYPALFSGRSTQ